MKAIRKRHPGCRIEIWFQDETRIGQQGYLTRHWGLRGLRLTVPRQMEYQWVYGFGAICPQTGNAVALVVPEVNTAMMNRLLQELSDAVAPEVHVILVLDRAAWHRSQGLRAFPNITLLHLPPYSPELNPIERVWAYLKSHYLAHQVYGNYDAIVETVCWAWNQFRQQIALIQSLTSEPWFMLHS